MTQNISICPTLNKTAHAMCTVYRINNPVPNLTADSIHYSPQFVRNLMFGPSENVVESLGLERLESLEGSEKDGREEEKREGRKRKGKI